MDLFDSMPPPLPRLERKRPAPLAMQSPLSRAAAPPPALPPPLLLPDSTQTQAPELEPTKPDSDSGTVDASTAAAVQRAVRRYATYNCTMNARGSACADGAHGEYGVLLAEMERVTGLSSRVMCNAAAKVERALARGAPVRIPWKDRDDEEEDSSETGAMDTDADRHTGSETEAPSHSD
jgi:hypothetical protein